MTAYIHIVCYKPWRTTWQIIHESIPSFDNIDNFGIPEPYMSNNDMPHRQLNDYYVTLISTPAPPNRLRHSEERSNCRRAIDHPRGITQASRSYHTHKSKGITKEHPTQYAIFVQVRKSIHCYLAQYQYLGKSSSCCYTCQQRKLWFQMISNDHQQS